jgi:hypothetical protein
MERNVMNLQEMKEQLVEWIGEFRFCRYDRKMYLDEREDRVVARLFTLTNTYSIKIYPPTKESPDGGLGGMALCRTPRAGESWQRGRDLYDGKFSKETWYKILEDIVGFELVKIHRPVSELHEDWRKEVLPRNYGGEVEGNQEGESIVGNTSSG